MHANRTAFYLCAGIVLMMIPLIVCAEEGDPEGRQRIDINCAGVDQLCAVPGIDIDLARNIVSYRNEKGIFKSKQELKSVPGMTPELLEEISPWLIDIPSNTCTVPESHPDDSDWEEKPIFDIPNC